MSDIKIQRDIIRIDEEKCDGCGLCVPACAEGALEMRDGRVHIIEDRLCDGLGHCIGECPKGALTVVQKEAVPFDEEAVTEKIKENAKSNAGDKQSTDFTKGGCGCPSGAPLMRMPGTALSAAPAGELPGEAGKSHLGNWPVQIRLIRPDAPFLENADLLLLADCAAVAFPHVQEQLIKGRVVMMGCPKLDDGAEITDRLQAIFTARKLNSITVAVMEVPCCGALPGMMIKALNAAEKDIPVRKVVISRDGRLLEE